MAAKHRPRRRHGERSTSSLRPLAPAGSAAIALGALLASAACHDEPVSAGAAGAATGAATGAAAQASAWPPGTVLAVDGEPITQAEVDEWLAVIALVERGSTLPHQRRLALTNIVLPRTVARMLDPVAYREALDRAELLHAALEDGGAAPEWAPEPKVVYGRAADIGLDIWWLCHDLEPGQWSRPHEHPGAWVVFRVLDEPAGEWQASTALRVESYWLPFVPEEESRSLIESGIDAMHLELVDPEWKWIVPEHYWRRMK